MSWSRYVVVVQYRYHLPGKQSPNRQYSTELCHWGWDVACLHSSPYLGIFRGFNIYLPLIYDYQSLPLHDPDLYLVGVVLIGTLWPAIGGLFWNTPELEVL